MSNPSSSTGPLLGGDGAAKASFVRTIAHKPELFSEVLSLALLKADGALVTGTVSLRRMPKVPSLANPTVWSDSARCLTQNKINYWFPPGNLNT